MLRVEYETICIRELDVAPCIFMAKEILVVFTWMTCLFIAKPKSAIDELKVELDKRFVTKDLGNSKQT